MSAPGRKPTPLHLRLVRGNPQRRPMPDGPKVELAPPGEAPRMPSGMSKEQKVIWKRVLRHAPARVLRSIDAELLHQWVVARAIFEDAEAKLRNSSLLIKTPNGMPAQSPFVGIINRQSDIMRAIASELGFTPAGRARLGVTDEAPGEDDEGF